MSAVVGLRFLGLGVPIISWYPGGMAPLTIEFVGSSRDGHGFRITQKDGRAQSRLYILAGTSERDAWAKHGEQTKAVYRANLRLIWRDDWVS